MTERTVDKRIGNANILKSLYEVRKSDPYQSQSNADKICEIIREPGNVYYTWKKEEVNL